MARVDVVVVGGGAMGATSAWRLARSGRSVVLCEQFAPVHDRGSSHGATRIFRVAYRDPRYTALALRALPLWRELEDATGDVLLEQVGQLDHGRASAVAEVADSLAAAGRPHEVLSPAAAAERWPGMCFDDAVVVSPEGGRCWADRTVAAAWRAAGTAGADLRPATAVRRVEVRGEGAVVHLPDGELEADVVVVAAGAWAAGLLDGVVELPPLLVTEEQPSHFRALDPAADWPSFLHHRPPADGVDRPLGFDAYGLLTPGEGVKVGGHGTGATVDPDHRSGIDPGRAAAESAYVAEWFPGLDPRPVSSTPCLFTSTPDDHFVLDRRGPVVVCSPCSGHGFKFVPAVAREVELLVGGAAQGDAAWRLPG
ncbi:MAG: FAD-dependent oxidoreductase [Microthrixaceae bacterium]